MGKALAHAQGKLFLLGFPLLQLFFLAVFSIEFFFKPAALFVPSSVLPTAPSAMAEAPQGWWKLTFLRKKKSQSKVLYEIPAEHVSNAAPAGAAGGHAEGSAHDPQLDARLGRIVDKTTASKGRHVNVSHSGRFKEKKKVRATLAENQDMFQGKDDSIRDDKRRNL